MNIADWRSERGMCPRCGQWLEIEEDNNEIFCILCNKSLSREDANYILEKRCTNGES